MRINYLEKKTMSDRFVQSLLLWFKSFCRLSLTWQDETKTLKIAENRPPNAHRAKILFGLIFFTLICPSRTIAQSYDIQQELNELTIRQIFDRGYEPTADHVSAHIAIRCSIFAGLMKQFLVLTLPPNADAETRENVERIIAQYEASELNRLSFAISTLTRTEGESAESVIADLYNMQFDTWAEGLSQAASYMFRRNAPASVEEELGENFRSENDICNTIFFDQRE